MLKISNICSLAFQIVTVTSFYMSQSLFVRIYIMLHSVVFLFTPLSPSFCLFLPPCFFPCLRWLCWWPEPADGWRRWGSGAGREGGFRGLPASLAAEEEAAKKPYQLHPGADRRPGERSEHHRFMAAIFEFQTQYKSSVVNAVNRSESWAQLPEAKSVFVLSCLATMGIITSHHLSITVVVHKHVHLWVCECMCASKWNCLPSMCCRVWEDALPRCLCTGEISGKNRPPGGPHSGNSTALFWLTALPTA